MSAYGVARGDELVNRNSPDFFYEMNGKVGELPALLNPTSAGKGSRNKTDLEQRNGLGG